MSAFSSRPQPLPRYSFGRSLAIVLGFMAFAAGLFPALLAMHDYFGRRNTRYAGMYSEAAFSGIQEGMSREQVIERLGAPLKSNVRKDWPVWALRDEQLRNRYGIHHRDGSDNLISIEILSYADPKDDRADFERVEVVINPEGKVIDLGRGVTD